MKKLMASLMTVLLLLTFTPAPVSAGTISNPTSIPANTPVPSPEATALINRLNEIKSIDKSSLSSKEKRQLRQETRAIKGHLKQLNGGVYLSAGAIILIVVLLIILL